MKSRTQLYSCYIIFVVKITKCCWYSQTNQTNSIIGKSPSSFITIYHFSFLPKANISFNSLKESLCCVWSFLKFVMFYLPQVKFWIPIFTLQSELLIQIFFVWTHLCIFDHLLNSWRLTSSYVTHSVFVCGPLTEEYFFYIPNLPTNNVGGSSLLFLFCLLVIILEEFSCFRCHCNFISPPCHDK